jgi:hypothetical protein
MTNPTGRRPGRPSRQSSEPAAPIGIDLLADAEQFDDEGAALGGELPPIPPQAAGANEQLALIMESLKFLIADNAAIKARLDKREIRPAEIGGERETAREAVRHDPAAGQILGRDGQVVSRRNDDSINPFDLPEDFIRRTAEDGYVLEWKRESTYGQPNDDYVSRLKDNGWEVVPASRLPGRYSAREEENYIRHQGMILMERRWELCEAARIEEHKKARAQVLMKHKSWGVDSPNEAVFNTTAANAAQHTLLRQAVEPTSASWRPGLQVVGDE